MWPFGKPIPGWPNGPVQRMRAVGLVGAVMLAVVAAARPQPALGVGGSFAHVFAVAGALDPQAPWIEGNGVATAGPLDFGELNFGTTPAALPTVAC